MSIYQTPQVYSNTVEMIEEVDICHRLKKDLANSICFYYVCYNFITGYRYCYTINI